MRGVTNSEVAGFVGYNGSDIKRGPIKIAEQTKGRSLKVLYLRVQILELKLVIEEARKDMKKYIPGTDLHDISKSIWDTNRTILWDSITELDLLERQ